jgi:hypothetical protein
MTNANNIQNDTNDGEYEQITEELGQASTPRPANETGSYGFVIFKADGSTTGYTECTDKAHALEIERVHPQAVACKVMWIGQQRRVRRMDGAKL